MRCAVFLFAAVMLAGCGTPYGRQGSLGGVKVWELPGNKVEILVVNRHNTDYARLSSMWKRKADEVASVRGASSYEIVSFSTGREVLGMEIMGEGSNIERYADESVFWFPKVARGVILLTDPDLPGTSSRAKARSVPTGFQP
ncbi:MAG: hypothetical protein JHD33_06165 [Chthoniobacterales bacterium]|jgi:hypothetical protein|nr:hypothetical protein [Chthoniobacterales bacterium]